MQSLLDAFSRATAFLPQAAASPATASEPPLPAGLGQGDVVGAFRLVKRIASGGMGTVYLAERVEGGFTQSVAIKVIAAPVVHEDAARRFRTERQILASLRHPYIVSLVDGGVTPRGAPVEPDCAACAAAAAAAACCCASISLRIEAFRLSK